MKRIFALSLMLLLPLVYAYAQEMIPFNGLVVDAAGKGVAHMSVRVKGTDKLAMTDHDGRFGLTNVAADAVLVMSMGKSAVEVPLNGRKSIKVMFVDTNSANAEEAQDIEKQGSEYVKRRELTSGREVILGEELRKSTADTLLEALVERSKSLTITNNGLTLLENASLEDSKPMIIVNDIEVEDLGMINMSDVDVVTIYKNEGECTACGFKGIIEIKMKNES